MAEPRRETLPVELAAAAPILKAVCQTFGVTLAELRGPCRARPIVRVRQLAMWILFYEGMGVADIGQALNRHHSTVSYGVKVMNRLLYQLPELKSYIAMIRRTVRENGRAPWDEILTEGGESSRDRSVAQGARPVPGRKPWGISG
jgi:hypothetical protein